MSEPQTTQDRAAQQAEQRERLRERMSRIRHKIVVLSGKGGVGKSTVAVNLAASLADEGFRVGLLDADIHGPSVPRIAGLASQKVFSDGQSIRPAQTEDGLRVMSIAFLLNKQDDAVIWRGPLKMGVLRQLLADVEWGDLDFLIIDLPPGTGDEPLSICQLIPEATGGIVVTTPQEVSLADVRKCIGFCRQLHLPVLGVLENMAGFVCPHCGERTDIFGRNGARHLSEQTRAPYLGSVPIDPRIVSASDSGQAFVRAYPESPAACAFREALSTIAELARE